jgi:aminoglycoside phosphotransferase (APT) family kinase protein
VHVWDAEEHVDEERARRLVRAQFPQLAATEVVLVSEGWDYLIGIVDWVDLCRSDPAVDLSVAWSTLEVDLRPAFFDAYGEVGDETRVRARVVAAFLCAMLADWARKEKVPSVLDAAVAGLRRAIDEDV